MANMGLLQKYAERLPPLANRALSLGEGGTPLLPLARLARALGLPPKARLWAKVEGANPTGSFKDRGMVAAVAHAAEAGASCVVCASTGNTSASAAAYANRAGLACVILAPAGKIAGGKMAQAVAYNARIVQIDGNFDDAMRVVRDMAASGAAAVVNSINPYRLQGQKTAAFEVIEQLGEAPEYHALPVGNAGNISAHWIGYCEAAGKSAALCNFCGGNCPHKGAPLPGGERPPALLGYQAAGAAPFVHGAPVAKPETAATAIRIGNPQSYDAAVAATKESGGHFAAVADERILQTQKLLAQHEGIFCEPASAASVAGVVADLQDKKIKADARIVCTLTGHGLKAPEVFAPPPAQAVAVAELPALLQNIVANIANDNGKA